ncbi:uncharacterized protein LOC143455669 [Clavelina lepadiformis]|uniref:Uncharacterized protein n=1 Tax=Clavelina lepadiformis TaxID=159417 RepID=A0ABP0FYB7_CLALP
MPSRRPILPGLGLNKILLRSLHLEMRQKKIITDNQSDSTTSEVESSSENKQNKKIETMSLDAKLSNHYGSDVSTTISDESTSTTSSQETQRQTSSWTNEHSGDVTVEGRPTGTSFGAKIAAFNEKFAEVHRNPSTNDDQARHNANELGESSGVKGDESDSSVTFPLESAAAGETLAIDIKEMKKLEKSAKRKIKIEKRAIAVAKMDVAEAKLSELGANLRARQARIDEQHAKLCRRRAAIKKAEDRLGILESRLDEEEEGHRERERRVKNRERRVKQEEAGIRIKEASLRKREEKITENLQVIERRRILVEEKEVTSSSMDDIMRQRESLHENEKNSRYRSLGKTNHGKETEIEGTTRRKRRDERKFSGSSGVQPTPTPRRTQEGRHPAGHRTSSSDVIGNHKLRHQTDSLPPRKVKGEAPKVGLWL